MPSPADFYADLHAQIGGRLFTVTVLDRAAGLARRVYTSHPDDYPVSGTKPMAQGAWTGMVVDRGETFVANTVAEFAIYFPDHETIKALGCQAACNIPIRDGQVIGTVNVLDVQGAFTPDRVARCQAIVAARHAEIVAAMGQADLS